MTDPCDISPALRAQKYTLMAQQFSRDGIANFAERHYNAAEQAYIDAGLDPDWFGTAHQSRECHQRCIPGHE